MLAVTAVGVVKLEPGGLDAGSGVQGTEWPYFLSNPYSKRQSVIAPLPAGSTFPVSVTLDVSTFVGSPVVTIGRTSPKTATSRRRLLS